MYIDEKMIGASPAGQRRQKALPALSGEAAGAAPAADSFQAYMTEIAGNTLLSREEEKDLATRYRENGDQEAADLLITSNLRLVVKIARDFLQYWSHDFLDLVQEGNLGLLHAARKFDPHKGAKYSYYASFWIRAYILKFILNNWRMVKIGTTQNQRKLFFNLGKERRRMIEEGLEPEPRALADRMGVREKDVEEMSLRMAHRDVYLDAPTDDGFYPDGYLSEGGSDPGAEEALSDSERRGLLMEKLAEFREAISGREADIFDRRLMTDTPETLKAVGETWSISRERVRQIQNRLLDSVTGWLRRELPEFDETYSDMVR